MSATAVRRWFADRSRWALVAGVLGAGALATTTTAGLGGFSASVTNTGDRVQSGSLLMQEQVTPSGGTVTTCLSTDAAATITSNAAACGANKFGALDNAAPGDTSFSTVVVTNQGSLPARAFSLTAGSCTATGVAGPGAASGDVGSDTAGFCGKVDVTVEDDTNSAACVYPAGPGACPAPSNSYTLTTLTAFAPSAAPVSLTAPVAAGAARTYKVAVKLDTTATNADQAMAATEPLTFTFGS